jgi:hypothetical protein
VAGVDVLRPGVAQPDDQPRPLRVEPGQRLARAAPPETPQETEEAQGLIRVAVADDGGERFEQNLDVERE